MPSGIKNQLNDTFLYGTPRRRSRRRGVWLRIKNLPSDVKDYFEQRISPLERISHVVVSQIKWDGVVLEAWCVDPNKFNIKEPVWTVVQLRTPENPDWVCEKNLGTGLRDANYYKDEQRVEQSD